MRIGIDVRLRNETGVGRYIRNITDRLVHYPTEHEFVLFHPAIRWHSIMEQVAIPLYVRSQQLDLVHYPYFSVPIFTTVPFVVTIHDLIIDSFETGMASTLPYPLYRIKRGLYTIVMKTALDRALRIIVPSQTTKKNLIKRYQVESDRIDVIYEGVDTKLIRSKPNVPDMFHHLQKTPFVLYVGSVYPHKNVERFIDAFEIYLKNASSLVRFVMVGKEDFFYRRLRKRLLPRMVKSVVDFMFDIDDRTLAWLYKNATCLVTPSLAEGFGLPGLEAMSFKTLVMASDIPVYREIYQDGAYFVDMRKTEAIVRALIPVLNRQVAPKLKAIREKGSRIAAHYSWDTAAVETLKTYERCARV